MRVHRRWIMGAAAAALAACATSAEVDDPVSPGAPLVLGISYVGIAVSDIEKSAAFYQMALGLTEVDRRRLAGVSALTELNSGKPLAAETRLLRGDRGQIRLMQFPASAAGAQPDMVPVQGPGITHVCHQSPDARPIFPRLVAAGAKPVSRTGDLVQLRPDVPVKYAYLRDRDGVMMETEQIIADNLPWSYRMRHVAIATLDIDRTVEFYTKLLGGPPRERRSNLVNPTLDLVSDLDNVKLDVAWYQINNLELEIWEYLNPKPSPPAARRPFTAYGYNVIVLDVSDVDAAVRLAAEAGGSVVTKSASMDGGHIAFVRDPEGNLIGLQKSAKGSPFSTASLTGS